MSRILLYSKFVLFIWEDFHVCFLFVLYKSVFLQIYILVLYLAFLQSSMKRQNASVFLVRL